MKISDVLKNHNGERSKCRHRWDGGGVLGERTRERSRTSILRNVMTPHAIVVYELHKTRQRGELVRTVGTCGFNDNDEAFRERRKDKNGNLTERKRIKTRPRLFIFVIMFDPLTASAYLVYRNFSYGPAQSSCFYRRVTCVCGVKAPVRRYKYYILIRIRWYCVYGTTADDDDESDLLRSVCIT